MFDPVDRGGRRAHAIEQRRAWLRLSHAARLAWLDQAKRFCTEALGAARKVKESPPGTPLAGKDGGAGTSSGE